MNGMQGHCQGSGNDRLHDRIDSMQAQIDRQQVILVACRHLLKTMNNTAHGERYQIISELVGAIDKVIPGVDISQ